MTRWNKIRYDAHSCGKFLMSSFQKIISTKVVCYSVRQTYSNISGSHEGAHMLGNNTFVVTTKESLNIKQQFLFYEFVDQILCQRRTFPFSEPLRPEASYGKPELKLSVCFLRRFQIIHVWPRSDNEFYWIENDKKLNYYWLRQLQNWWRLWISTKHSYLRKSRPVTP